MSPGRNDLALNSLAETRIPGDGAAVRTLSPGASTQESTPNLDCRCEGLYTQRMTCPLHPGRSYTAHWEALGRALCLLTTPEISSTGLERGRGRTVSSCDAEGILLSSLGPRLHDVGGQTLDARFEGFKCKANTLLTLRSTNVEPSPLLI